MAHDTVLFVHGNPGGGDEWRDLEARVASFAPTLAPDLPGFGGADAPPGFDYSIGAYARHLRGVLRDADVERTHLVLHDLGGAWGIELILQEPELVASVTLLGIGVFHAYRWHRWARIWRLPVLGELVNYSTPRFAARAIAARENPHLSADQVDRLSRQMAQRRTRRAILASYRAIPPAARGYRGGVRLADQLAPLDIPALVLWPTEDHYVPYEPEYQREAFPSARIEIVEGCGHWLHWEAPDEVASHVIPFLREQIGRRGDGTDAADEARGARATNASAGRGSARH